MNTYVHTMNLIQLRYSAVYITWGVMWETNSSVLMLKHFTPLCAGGMLSIEAVGHLMRSPDVLAMIQPAWAYMYMYMHMGVASHVHAHGRACVCMFYVCA